MSVHSESAHIKTGRSHLAQDHFQTTSHTQLVRSPDPQPRNVRLGKRYVTPVVFFRYTVGTVYFMVSLCFWHCVSKQPSNSKIPKCQILSIVNIAVSERLSPKTLQILYFLHVFVQKCQNIIVNIAISERLSPKTL